AAGGMGAPRLPGRSALLLSLPWALALDGTLRLRPVLLRQLLREVAREAADARHALRGPARRRGAGRRECFWLRLFPERDESRIGGAVRHEPGGRERRADLRSARHPLPDQAGLVPREWRRT